jgi:hypothetical protein
MQSQIADATRPAKMNIVNCAKWIYQQNGYLGFYRGVTPRIGLSVYLTVCMVTIIYFDHRSLEEIQLRLTSNKFILDHLLKHPD